MGKENDSEKASGEDFEILSSDSRKYVWMGAIPLLVHLHESEVTSLPAPPPFLVLAPRNGYLPLLADAIKPHFQSALPPGSDTVWFDYEGLPLKWHIPTGVLFDLLCVEPERPWKLTVHFRAYPLEVLSPCDGEDAVKWHFVNALKEASYVMYGNTKSVMNLSQHDQVELWKSVVKGDLEGYDHISNRLKPGLNLNSAAPWNWGMSVGRPSSGDSDVDSKSVGRGGSDGNWPGRIPMRIYIRSICGNPDDLCDSPPVHSWDKLVYMTRPIDFPREKGLVLTLRDVLMKVVPHLFLSFSSTDTTETETIGVTSGDSNERHPGESSAASNLPNAVSEKPETQAGEAIETATSPSSDKQSTESSTPSEEGLEEQARISAQDALDDLDRSPDGQGGTSTRRPPECLWEGQALGSAKQFQGIVRIQGIEPNLDLPLDWVARNLCGPEQFIHLCICTWITP